jgi:hypothetical protein
MKLREHLEVDEAMQNKFILDFDLADVIFGS